MLFGSLDTIINGNHGEVNDNGQEFFRLVYSVMKYTHSVTCWIRSVIVLACTLIAFKGSAS